MLAKDIMTHQVVTASPNTPVSEIAELLLKNCISAVPVVDDRNAVIGIVSEGDLIRRPEADTEKRGGSWWLGLVTSSWEMARDYSKSHGRRASDVMTKNVVTVEEDTSAAEIAETLEKNHIKRVPVVRNGQLIGIVSRANLIRGVATAKRPAMPVVSEDDRTLQQAVVAALRKQPWANLAYVNATVDDGVVHLWGLSESPEQRNAYEVAASDVPGVKSVQNHLSRALPEFYWAE